MTGKQRRTLDDLVAAYGLPEAVRESRRHVVAAWLIEGRPLYGWTDLVRVRLIGPDGHLIPTEEARLD